MIQWNYTTKTVLFYALLIIAFIIYIFFYTSPIRLAHGIYINHPKAIQPFELMDNKSNPFTENHLKNHWSLLFFGFSSCEMICPMTMKVFQETVASLPKSKRLEVIFISVDPERDTIQKLDDFVRQYNKDFIPLRGSLSAINVLQKQLHVTISSTPMRHGMEILLVNPEAKVQAYFYYPISAQNLMGDLRQIIY